MPPPLTPSTTLALIPQALTREPAAEAVLVGWADGVDEAVVLSVPLDADEAALLIAARQLAVDGATHAVVVTYTDDAGVPLARWVVGRLVDLLVDEAAVTGVDALRVTGDRWRSYTCHDPACRCQTDGTPITPTPTPTGDTP